MSEVSSGKLKKRMVKICQRLHRRNLLAAADGNVSFKMSESEILITPSGIAKAFMDFEDMAVIDIEGNVIKGNPSAEKSMHLQVYRSCREAKAVIHAHPPCAIAWSLSHPERSELPCDILPEVLLATGGIPIVPYARPTTNEMATTLEPFLDNHKVMILARHGALSWGSSLEEAYNGMERVEHSAEILRLAYSMGELKPINEAELSALWAMRKGLGNKSL